MSRLDDAFRRIGKASIPGESVWQSGWSEKKLRFINENVWIAQHVLERRLSGATDADFILWEAGV